MTQKNHYHVVYTGLSNATDQLVQCTVTILIENPIQYQSDIRDIKLFIENNYNTREVAIVNWFPLLGLNRANSK